MFFSLLSFLPPLFPSFLLPLLPGGVLKGVECVAMLRKKGYAGVIIGFTGDESNPGTEKSPRTMFLQAGADASWGKPLPSIAVMKKDIWKGFNVQRVGGSPPRKPSKVKSC
jgi:hypothetical protein